MGKSSEMSQISKWKDFQKGLWVLEQEVTYRFKAGAANHDQFYDLGFVIRPLPSSKNSHFQNEARCATFLVKMSFICMRMKNDFHIRG